MRTLRPFFAALALALLAAGLPPGPSASADEPALPSAIRAIGKLERIPADAVALFGNVIVPPHFSEPIGTAARRNAPVVPYTGTVIVLPHARQLWQFFGFANFEPKTAVVVRDLDTLRIRHHFVHPSRLRRSTTQTGGEWMHASDGDRRLFLLDQDQQNVIEFDLRTFAARQRRLGPPRVVSGQPVAGMWVGGMAYDPTDDSLLALMGSASSTGVGSTFLTRLRLGDGAWDLRAVRACDSPLPSNDLGATYAMPPLADAEAVYVTCRRSSTAGVVVRMARDSLFNPAGPEDQTAGPVSPETVLLDPVGKRLYLITITGEIWAFDPGTMSFVAVIASARPRSDANKAGYGVDEESGRVFFLTDTYGLGVVEGRFFPVPQARTLPTAAHAGQERIHSDARTGRVFVLPGYQEDKLHDYTIYSVGLAPKAPPPPDPDRSTADVDEVPGRTEAKYFASASGYGVRVLMAKGAAPMLPAPSAGTTSPVARVIDDHVNSKCGYTDREMVAGRVAKAEYDTGSSSAVAAAVDVDDRTKQDLEHLSRCDVTAKNGGTELFSGIYSKVSQLPDEGRPWQYIPASCSSGDGRAQSADGDNQDEPSLGTSRVECPEPGGRLHAEAYADLTSKSVKVGSAFTVVNIEKNARGGVVSTATSFARDVDIGGFIHIGEVRSQAVSRATGRPSKHGAPMSTYRTLIKGVTMGDTTVCEGGCDTATVIGVLNQAANGRVLFRTASGLDARLLKGSPRGAQTAVQKSPERQASDSALVGDSTSDVPGLELTVYNDNAEWGRARQVYQFAGVTTTANYNIVPLPSFADLLDDDEGPSRPDGLALDVTEGDDATLAVGLGDFGGGSGGGGEGGIVGAINRALRAVVDGFKLLVTDPRRAFLVLTAWAVLVVPVALNRRRRLLLAARTT